MLPRLKQLLFRFLPHLSIILLLASTAIMYVLETDYAEKEASGQIILNLNDASRRTSLNRLTLLTLQEEADEQAIAKARALAYMLELKASIISSGKELEKIREMLAVDELHISDDKGILCASTIPGYLGYAYDSSPQSAAFMLAIDYPGFALAQRPMPKGIDHELFQYTGVARTDQRGIVQIGYKPERVLEAMKAADISAITRNMRIGKRGSILITDLDGITLSSADSTKLGRNIEAFGIEPHLIKGAEGSFYGAIDGVACYGYYKATDKHLMIGWMPVEELFALRNSSLLVFFSIGLLTLVLPTFLLQSADKHKTLA